MNAAAPSLRMHAVVIDCAEFAPLIAFWSAALGYVEWFAPHGQFAGIKPPVRDGRLAIIFQRVPEPKIVKNRVHVDYEADAMGAEVGSTGRPRRAGRQGRRDGYRRALDHRRGPSRQRVLRRPGVIAS